MLVRGLLVTTEVEPKRISDLEGTLGEVGKWIVAVISTTISSTVLVGVKLGLAN